MIKQILYIFLFFICAVSIAQEPIRFTTKQGLPSNHIYDIQQDKEGFMWFATNRGVVKFDGTTFKTFTSKDGLPNNDTWRLEPDLQGRMWYYAKSKYQGYIKNDSVYKFITQDSVVLSPKQWSKSKTSIGFYSDHGSVMLEDNMFMIKDVHSEIVVDEIVSKYNYSAIADGFSYNPIKKEYVAVLKGEILFFDNHLILKDRIIHKTPRFKTDGLIRFSGTLYQDTFFYITDEGILFVNEESKNVRFHLFSDLVPQLNGYELRVNGLKDEIQISIRGHLFRFDYSFDLLEIINHSKDLPHQSSYKDKDGNIWLSDINQGVVFIPQIQNKVERFLNKKKVQKLNIVNNQIVAGVDKEGFYFLNELKDQFTIDERITSNGKIYQIQVRENKSYFISGHYSMVLQKGIYTRFVMKKIRGLKLNEIQYGFKDVIKYKGNNYSITAATIFKNDELTNVNTVPIIKAGLSQFEIYKDHLYVSGSDGLFQLKNDSLYKVSISNEFIDMPINNLKSQDDLLWIGTDGRGVLAYSKNEVHHIKSTEDLSIQRIIKKDSVLWLATQNGVKKVQLNKNDISSSALIDSFYEEDGLLENNINDIFIENDYLYGATDSGLSMLNLEDSIYKRAPDIYFTNKKDTLVIQPEHRDNVSVSFSSLQFSGHDYNTYEYRMLPIQKEWVTTRTKILNFSHLPPDFYTLELKATDQHNNTTQINKYIVSLPYWWQTTLAKVLGVMVVIGFFFLLLKLIQSSIRKVETAKSERAKKVSRLELQALRSQMNPHFVHNSLNAIQYYIQRNEVDLSEEYLTKFSKLIRLFFEYSRKPFITIKKEVDLLENYLQIEKLRFEDKLSYSIHIDKDIEEDIQKLPSMMLQPIVENAVNHGLFHKKENGCVTIRFIYIDETTFQVIIEDNGIGIYKTKELYKSTTNNNQDRSSNVLEDRLELFKTNKEWDITYSIKDKSDLPENNTNETGTLVSLLFKNYK